VQKRLFIALLAAITASLAICVGQASADPDSNNGTSGVTDAALLALIVDDDLFATVDLSTVLDPPPGTGTPTQHYGPFPSGSPDSGTCGNDWAEDTFNREFTVRTSNSGAITVVEQFKQGSFVTNAGPSPAACDVTYTNHGTVIVAGKTGSMHGYFIVPLPAGTMQTSTDSSCVAGNPSAPCTTTGFINSHFTPCYPATCTVTTFFFHYAAGDQSLLFHEWKNASPDRGGNSGDIASS
jgi:hypothetical protein